MPEKELKKDEKLEKEKAEKASVDGSETTKATGGEDADTNANKNLPMRKWGMIGAVIAAFGLYGLATFGNVDKTEHQPVAANETVKEKNQAFMEDKTNSKDTISIEEAQKVTDDLATFRENVTKPTVNMSAEKLHIDG